MVCCITSSCGWVLIIGSRWALRSFCWFCRASAHFIYPCITDAEQCGPHNGTFLCGNLRCIYEEWTCDQRDDCGDYSDELHCFRKLTYSNLDQGHSDSTFLNFFSWETTKRIEAKFHVDPPCDGGTKICSNGYGHLTKMAAMSIYGKNMKNSSSL